MNLSGNEIGEQLRRLGAGLWREAQGKSTCQVICFGDRLKPTDLSGLGIEPKSPLAERLLRSKKAVEKIELGSGVIWFVRPLAPELDTRGGTGGRLEPSPRVRVREAVGAALADVFDDKEAIPEVKAVRFKSEWWSEVIFAAEVSAYRFKSFLAAGKKRSVVFHGLPSSSQKSNWKSAQQLGSAVNIARHVVNLPGNALHPESMAQAVKVLFRGLAGVKVEIWDRRRLKKEQMGLHLAVGEASEFPPCLVRIRYRPKSGGGAPLALVGKGITFDSGGLNLKPDSNMRLMKKDMGGSAAVLALAWWTAISRLNRACDFYLAIAENSVSGRAFRPGDILTSRSGQTVEIHNTDAEGRLVLADAFSVAVGEKNKPSMLIDVATLTGAIKSGLGSQVGGLFGNDDRLVSQLDRACNEVGDWVWPMPLFRKYRGSLKSNVADMVNSSDGFGGAITAALFLESFTEDVPWAHFDIYAWRDSAEGPIAESGGSGQSVVGLANFLAKKL